MSASWEWAGLASASPCSTGNSDDKHIGVQSARLLSLTHTLRVQRYRKRGHFIGARARALAIHRECAHAVKSSTYTYTQRYERKQTHAHTDTQALLSFENTRDQGNEHHNGVTAQVVMEGPRPRCLRRRPPLPARRSRRAPRQQRAGQPRSQPQQRRGPRQPRSTNCAMRASRGSP